MTSDAVVGMPLRHSQNGSYGLDELISLPAPVVPNARPLACPDRWRSVRVIPRSRRPAARERSLTAVRLAAIFVASLRHSRASALMPSAASPESVG